MTVKQAIKIGTGRDWKYDERDNYHHLGYATTTFRIVKERLTIDNTLTIIAINLNDIYFLSVEQVFNDKVLHVKTTNSADIRITL